METDSEDSDSGSEEWEEVPNGEVDEVSYITARQNESSTSNPTTSGAGDGHLDSDRGAKAQESQIPSSGLKIIVPNQNGLNFRKRGKHKKGNEIIGNYIVREINKCKREVIRDIHRVYLLSHFARGLMYNRILNSDIILQTALSILPADKRSYPAKNLDLNYLEKFIKWFKSAYTLTSKQEIDNRYPPISTLAQSLQDQIKSHKVEGNCFLALVFVVILRAMGIQVRLVCNLDPPPIRPHTSDLMKLLKNEDDEPQASTSTSKPKNLTRKAKPPPKKAKTSIAQPPDPELLLSDEDSSSDSEPKRKKSRKRKAKSKSPRKDKTNADKGRKKRNSGRKFVSSDEDDMNGGNAAAAVQTPRKAKSREECNVWAEVYLEEEEQWVSVDILEAKLLSEATIVAKATHPVCYVISYSGTGGVKDVTTRYSAKWWSDIGKLRDQEWWTASIRRFYDRKSGIDQHEDEFLRQHLLTLPIPTTISAFKNHPLYVLRRHLLKFEAIYPPDVIPCGYMKDEPAYPRSSVYTLNGRETWLRKARVVRIGERPYKTVKARPKFNRNTGMIPRDEPLELFGEWQTEDYEPPIAVGGKVPRNEFGNVDLYTPKMIPIGTVHLQLPGLNRVARKLDVDCAPAVIGFEFHAGGCHPKFDGFIVCEEYKDILEDAWSQEQEEIEKRGEERRLKKIYDRWAKLCKGLLIRQKLERRYNYDFSSSKAKQ